MSKKELHELLRIFKPYYDFETNSVKKDAPKEAVDAFRKFNKIWDILPPIEEEPKNK